VKIKKQVKKFKKLEKRIAALLPLQEAAMTSENDDLEDLIKISA
jgi:hypothetical protein